FLDKNIRQNNELETSSDSEATEKALKLPASLLSGAGREIVRLFSFGAKMAPAQTRVGALSAHHSTRTKAWELSKSYNRV
ncbi:MAG: hypothetical protein ACLQMV_07055, partial [Rhodoblastus sp.]|uniref:hypothetical protein n=1 Tax=Rhodoblastus sp. TaxID=1962975 RepID=UPI003FD8C782